MFWIITFILTAIPVGLLMTGIYYLNEHEKQPLWMLGLSFIGGFLTFGLVRLTSNLLNGNVYELSAGSPFSTHDWGFFLIAFGLIAVVEELSKFIIVNVFSFRSKRFKYPYDGIAYAVFVSLGFAFIENMMYLYQRGLGIAINRAIFTIPAHAAFGVVMGYYLGLAKSCKIKGLDQDAFKMRYIAFFAPLILHGLYDYICNFNDIPWAYYVLIGYTILLYLWAFYRMYKFNQLNYKIYQDKKEYHNDDIQMDYDDDMTVNSERIHNRLFEEHSQGDWSLDDHEIKTENTNMKMFSNHEESDDN